MNISKKILLLALFGILSFSANAGQFSLFSNMALQENQDKVMDLDILINGNSLVTMKGVPTTGYLEIFSILGVKTQSINLASCTSTYPLNISKGLYILKAGRVAQKVVAR